jgi:hypothetical protein
MRIHDFAASWTVDALKKAPPRSVFMAILWITARTHPLMGLVFTAAVLAGWSRAMRDD